MILGYRDRKTRAFAEGRSVRAFRSFENQAARRLAILNAAPSLDTLRSLPGNHLEALPGDRMPVLHSDQPAVETVFRVAGRSGGTGQR